MKQRDKDLVKSPERAQTSTPAGLSRMEAMRGMRMSVYEGSFATVFAVLTAGAFLTGFGLWLGANSVQIGLLTAIPTFAGLVQIIASYTGEKRSTRKPFAGGFALIGRLLWLPILLLPFIFHNKQLAVLPFLVLFTASFVLLHASVPPWTSWMSDLVPPDYRGRYFARRNMIAGIVGMVVSLPAAWFLDLATQKHHWEAAGFGTLFAVACVASLVAFAFILRQPEPPKTVSPDGPSVGGLRGVADYLKAPFADANFRRLMSFNTIFVLGQFFAAPFFTVYALQDLKLNYVWLQIFATLTSISSLASMPLWGYLADKFGNKPLLAISVWGVFTLPIVWMFTTPSHMTTTMLLLVELNLVGGMFWAGVGLTQFNLLIGFSPPGKTSIYVATMSAVTGFAGGLAPLLGGACMSAVAASGWHANLLGMHMGNYHITFLIAAILRIAALPLLRSVVDARAVETRDVIRLLKQAKPKSWRHIRRLQHGDQEERLRATEALAGSKIQLAGEELKTALMDPSEAVRSEAARALGEIGDQSAVEALIAAIHDPAAALVEEAAASLARIGDRRANAPLAALLRRGPDRLSRRDRVAVVKALGELGGHDAVTALLEALQKARTDEDEEILEAAASALGKTGSSRAAPGLISLLESGASSAGLLRIVVRALGEIGDASAIDPLRQMLAQKYDDPILVPLLADAFARLEDRTAAISLIPALQQLESPIARRQVAHAIGRLIEQGDMAYALLSQDAMTRDASIEKLITDLRKGAPSQSAESTLRVVQKAHSNGDMQDCLRAMARLVRTASAMEDDAETGVQMLCRRCLEEIAHSEEQTPEAALLAFCALKGAITSPGEV